MARVMHECEENDRGRPIEYWTGTKRWYAYAVGNWVIYHCPYCGLKLEPPKPPVMIEVSQGQMVEWAKQLTKECRQNYIGHGDKSWLVIRGVIGSMQDVLDD